MTDGAILIGLLALSLLPAAFSFVGKARNALLTGLAFLIALIALASIQDPGRNMAAFLPLAFAWIVMALLFAAVSGFAGRLRRRVKERIS